MTTASPRKIAIYERTALKNPSGNETIDGQQHNLLNRVKTDPELNFVARYVDDGVSGIIEMADRPAGKDLLRDAEAHLFDEVWVRDINRLSRTATRC